MEVPSALSSPSLKNIKNYCEKIPYVFSKKAFPIFRETELFRLKSKRFQERNFRARKTKKPLWKNFLY